MAGRPSRDVSQDGKSSHNLANMAKADTVEFTHGLPQAAPFLLNAAAPSGPPNGVSAAAALETSLEQNAAAALVQNVSANVVARTLGDETQLCPTQQLRLLLQVPESEGAAILPTLSQMPDSPTNLQVQYSTISP